MVIRLFYSVLVAVLTSSHCSVPAHAGWKCGEGIDFLDIEKNFSFDFSLLS